MADTTTTSVDAHAEVAAKFVALERESVDVERFKSQTNEGGWLAWQTAYLLEAYLDMYESTRDHGYLRKFLEMAEAVAERTDARRGLADYKGKRRNGWGAVKYSRSGERVVWLVHSGMITYPMVRFAKTVGEIPGLMHLAPLAHRFKELTEDVLLEFEGQWRYDAARREGYYVYEDDLPAEDTAGLPVPFNQQLAAGRALLMLWKVTGKPAHLEKVVGLGRHFKRHLRRQLLTGAYDWDYWYGTGLLKYNERASVAYGAIDADFAVLAWRESVVFSREDMARLVEAFLQKTRVAGGRMQRASDATGRWLGLSEVDCGLYRVVAPYLMGKTGAQSAEVLLGVAKLTRYADRCAKV
jgi:hypothetical protein